MTIEEIIEHQISKTAALSAIIMAMLEWKARETDAPDGYLYGIKEIAKENLTIQGAPDFVIKEVEMFMAAMPDVTEGMTDPDAGFFDDEDT